MGIGLSKVLHFLFFLKRCQYECRHPSPLKIDFLRLHESHPSIFARVPLPERHYPVHYRKQDEIDARSTQWI
jgi:hypothetical protein